jgi:hypothetical protein
MASLPASLIMSRITGRVGTHQRRDERVDQRWGRLARVVKSLSDDPRRRAPGQGAPRASSVWSLTSLGPSGTVPFSSKTRRVPWTRANIDHLAIAASRVSVIDAKRFKGMVERRDKGGWFKIDFRSALSGADVPINAALCFIEAGLEEPLHQRCLGDLGEEAGRNGRRTATTGPS